MKILGLIGKTLTHSFSKKYFSQKFKQEKIAGYEYQLFPLENIDLFPKLLESKPNLVGLNVTIPYKEAVVPFLDEIDASAKFGAVNTIAFKKNKLIGYNTDVFGFKNSIKNHIDTKSPALILGTGGAAKAIVQALQLLGVSYTLVSRQRSKNAVSYQDLDATMIQEHQTIVNATPLGTFPDIAACPDLPYHLLSPRHLLIDLVYNPATTTFLQKGAERGCTLKNGLEMLHLQAEKAWEIWKA